MKSVLFAAFAASAAAQSAVRYTGTAEDASGNTIQDGVINASGLYFYVGKPTQTGCGKGQDPQSANCVSNTKNNKTTIFKYTNGQGEFALDSVYNHGQTVYVEPHGALAFSTSAAAPNDALIKGFARGVGEVMKFEDKDWLACPVQGDDNVVQLFAQSRSTRTDCTPLTFQLVQQQEVNQGGPAEAYEYI
ncbi:hypothetical protein CERZMDRAFT_100697 [Cercospora zeae-maydis SCOH1-5]|uniref:Cell wall protein PhiA n=1 Tax=Cercospora zeae-maydis SCOH1-5 TaxID=717836 RepID=A0A6A6F5Z1_9PEZI|nr:hypothetical protein CERZMDRAFT_100697 [Cercospora zeae-maydis SCOH1-5]